MPAPKTVGHQIKIARVTEGMSRQELADALGVTVSAISRWERDETKPSAMRFLGLIRLLPSLDTQRLADAAQ